MFGIITINMALLLQVLEQRPDGIWKGYVLREGQMAKAGYFPASAVVLVDWTGKLTVF